MSCPTCARVYRRTCDICGAGVVTCPEALSHPSMDRAVLLAKLIDKEMQQRPNISPAVIAAEVAEKFYTRELPDFCTPPEQCCIDIFREIGEGTAMALPTPIRAAWRTGKELLKTGVGQ